MNKLAMRRFITGVVNNGKVGIGQDVFGFRSGDFILGRNEREKKEGKVRGVLED